MRLGATLAACQAAASTPFHSLVLWDPCLSGRTFLREGEALFALGEDDGRVHDDGLRHTPGFQYDAETASAMRTVDLAKIPADRPLADRVLLLSARTGRLPRASRSGSGSSRAAWTSGRRRRRTSCSTARPATATSRRRRSPPSWTRWSPAAASPGTGQGARGAQRPAVVGGTRVAPRPRAPDADRTDRPLRRGGQASHHHPRALGGPGQRGCRAPPRSRPALGRVARGLGRGRVPGSSGSTRPASGTARSTRDRSRTGCAPEWIGDMREVVQTLSADGAPVVVVGLCSGSLLGVRGGAVGEGRGGLRGQPAGHVSSRRRWAPTSTPRSAERASCRPGPWAALAKRQRILAGGIWRLYRQVAVWQRPVPGSWRSVVKRGTAVHVSTCRDDGQHFTEVLFWPAVHGRPPPQPAVPVASRTRPSTLPLLSRRGPLVTFERASEFLATYAALPAADQDVRAS